MNALGLASSLIIGPDRKLRMLWRAAIFFALFQWVIPLALDPPFNLFARAFHITAGLTAPFIALLEFEYFIDALICTAAFALYERRRVDSYGLPVEQALSARTAEGALGGIIMAGAVAVGMYLLGGMQIHGLALAGSALVLSALGWLGTNICIGVAEEFWFRSYLLQTLWKSIGFWPAAIVIALIFAGEHYFLKPGENIWDVITLISFSLMLSYSVLRTGTLWFAVGFHAGFDYMQLFIIGTPNGSQLPQGRLLDATFHGPAWLTGGVLGTEASVLMYPMFALVWLYIWWRFRATPPANAARAA
jgi:uncharacterized protein